MEANEREDSRISIGDFLARVPLKTRSRNTTRFKAMVGKNALSGRMRRFRLHAGVLSWAERVGVDTMVEFLLKNGPRIDEHEDTSLERRYLPRDERDRILHNHFEKFPERSRYKDPAVRQQYIKNTQEDLKEMHRNASAGEEEKEQGLGIDEAHDQRSWPLAGWTRTCVRIGVRKEQKGKNRTSIVIVIVIYFSINEIETCPTFAWQPILYPRTWKEPSFHRAICRGYSFSRPKPLLYPYSQRIDCQSIEG